MSEKKPEGKDRTKEVNNDDVVEYDAIQVDSPGRPDPYDFHSVDPEAARTGKHRGGQVVWDADNDPVHWAPDIKYGKVKFDAPRGSKFREDREKKEAAKEQKKASAPKSERQSKREAEEQKRQSKEPSSLPSKITKSLLEEGEAGGNEEEDKDTEEKSHYEDRTRLFSPGDYIYFKKLDVRTKNPHRVVDGPLGYHAPYEDGWVRISEKYDLPEEKIEYFDVRWEPFPDEFVLAFKFPAPVASNAFEFVTTLTNALVVYQEWKGAEWRPILQFARDKREEFLGKLRRYIEGGFEYYLLKEDRGKLIPDGDKVVVNLVRVVESFPMQAVARVLVTKEADRHGARPAFESAPRSYTHICDICGEEFTATGAGARTQQTCNKPKCKWAHQTLAKKRNEVGPLAGVGPMDHLGPFGVAGEQGERPKARGRPREGGERVW